MVQEFTQAEADRHNTLTAKGWALTKGRLVLHGTEPSGRPGWFSRWQLRRAIRCFEKALAINPEGWSSMWALGKIYQSLGDQAFAFDWFAKAHAISPDQPDVAREASIAALDIGRVADALALCRAALASKPNDPGLVCNLALAHCLAGQDEEAERCAAEATRCDPTDEISATVLEFVLDVASGKKVRPRKLCEVFPYG
jgi:Flp pilus assembly protein TadD